MTFRDQCGETIRQPQCQKGDGVCPICDRQRCILYDKFMVTIQHIGVLDAALAEAP